MAGVFSNYPYGTSSTYFPLGNTAPQPRQQTVFDYVLGEQAAKSYILAPGTRALLMDSEQPIFYIKTVDANGMPAPLRIFDYTERTTQPQSEEVKMPTNDYISRSEFESFKDEIQNSLRNRKWDSNTKKMTNKEAN